MNTSVPRRAIIRLGPGMYACFLGLPYTDECGLAVDAARAVLRALAWEGENSPRPSVESVDSHDGVNDRIFGIFEYRTDAERAQAR